jgi:hypothetical protein
VAGSAGVFLNIKAAVERLWEHGRTARPDHSISGHMVIDDLIKHGKMVGSRVDFARAGVAVKAGPQSPTSARPRLCCASTQCSIEARYFAAVHESAPGRLCCKSLKTPGDKSPARRRNKPRSLIDVASGSLPKSPVSLSPGDGGPPHVYSKVASTARKICDRRCKRLLQHNLPIGDILRFPQPAMKIRTYNALTYKQVPETRISSGLIGLTIAIVARRGCILAMFAFASMRSLALASLHPLVMAFPRFRGGCGGQGSR